MFDGGSTQHVELLILFRSFVATLATWVTPEKVAMTVNNALLTDLQSWRADDFLQRVNSTADESVDLFENQKARLDPSVKRL